MDTANKRQRCWSRVIAAAFVATGLGASTQVQGQCCTLQGETVLDYSDQVAAFGASLAISGDYAIVGGPRGGPIDQGAVFFLHKDGDWTHGDIVVASDSESLAFFGSAVAMHNGVAVVGAPGHDSIAEDAGQAYVFVQSGEPPVWTEQQSLLPSTPPEITEDFGRSVAIRSETLVVGLPGYTSGQGAAMVFSLIEGAWEFTAVLQAPEPSQSEQFGWAIAMADEVLLVGENDLDEPGTVHVFRRQTDDSWAHEQILNGTAITGGDGFGRAVAIDGDVALIGAPFDGDAALLGGAAYVFHYIDQAWSMEQKAFACSPAGYEGFGWSVAIDGAAAAVGAPALVQQGFGGAGRAFSLSSNGSQWQVEANLVQSTFIEYGASVAVRGDDVLVGGLKDAGTSGGELSGAAAFDLGNFCPADVNDDGTVSVEDLADVILAWGTSDPDADTNCDGTVDVQDLVTVIMHWGQECELQGAPATFWECIDRCGDTDPDCIVGCGEMFGLFE